MKKTYINPEIEVVKMKIQQHLLEGSITVETGSTPTDPGSSDGHFDEFDW